MNYPRLLPAVLASAAFLVMPSAVQAQASGAQSSQEAEGPTQDIVYMEDGRILHGQIQEEDSRSIVMDVVISGIKSTITLQKGRIDTIERDMPVEGGVAAEEEQSDTSSTATGTSAEETTIREAGTYGAQRYVEGGGEDVPVFYMIPMDGQMGTDINSEIYAAMVDDIRAKDPDFLVIKMNCRPEDPLDLEWGEAIKWEDLDERGFDGSEALDEYRRMMNVFKDELGRIPQVLWIEDSEGISSVLALAWPDIYMMPEAELAGMASTASFFQQVAHDANLLGKFREAYMGWLKGFVEYGGYPLELIDALVRPEFELSATWRGREVEWTLDTAGEYVLDSSAEDVINFDAKMAEDFSISDGTAETIEDLALLMGIREFRVVDGESDDIYVRHKENWRRAFKECRNLMEDFFKYMSWASGEDTIVYLGRSKSALERVANMMRRYKAVEMRMGNDFGITLFAIEMQVEILQEQIRALRNRNRGGGRGGGRGGSGPGAGGAGRR